MIGLADDGCNPSGPLAAELYAIKLCGYSLNHAAHVGIRCFSLAERAHFSVLAKSATAIATFSVATSIPTKASL